MSKTYAFIDMQNIHLGVRSLGWDIDWKKFLIYLQKKYHTEKIFLFLGHIPSNKNFYKKLQKWGYTLVFKEVVVGKDGKYKGNVDAELVLEVVDKIKEYNSGILVSGDGDFLCLLNYWKKHKKNYKIFSASKKNTSFLLKKYGTRELLYIERLKNILSKKPPKNSGG